MYRKPRRRVNSLVQIVRDYKAVFTVTDAVHLPCFFLFRLANWFYRRPFTYCFNFSSKHKHILSMAVPKTDLNFLEIIPGRDEVCRASDDIKCRPVMRGFPQSQITRWRACVSVLPMMVQQHVFTIAGWEIHNVLGERDKNSPSCVLITINYDVM
jgi:hypothetical protein